MSQSGETKSPGERRLPAPVRVLGVPVDPVGEGEFHELVARWVEEHRATQVATVNVEFVMLARRDREFARVLEEADVRTADSAGVIWYLRRRGIYLSRRVGGSDLIWSLCEQSARLGHRVFLLGGQPGVAEAAAKVLVGRYPGLHLAGTYAGSPAPEEDASIVHLIRLARADILFVAFGAPDQDFWIARNLKGTGVSIAIGVGGSFDYVAGTARRAPIWMRESGLEWSWRLIRQPWRWRRMLALPHFVWLVWWSDLVARRTKG